ncbi:MAG: precorrin-8X methylmutase [Thermohalobaculum sp.]
MTDSPGGLRYERDPHEIYRQSFATVRAETGLDHLPHDLHDIAIRLVHSCGMTDVANRLAWSDDMTASARAALAAGAPILCDCEMVASGIVRARLPADNPVICTLNDPATPELARKIANTRSAAAVELWRDQVEGSIAVIGNAPTALFHLLELLDHGWPEPAAIIAMPVGFVGAAESKAELAANPRGVPFLTLHGRRGGSAMASAVVNALSAGLEAPQ